MRHLAYLLRLKNVGIPVVEFILRGEPETPSSDLCITLIILSSIIINGNINTVQTKTIPTAIPMTILDLIFNLVKPYYILPNLMAGARQIS
jgi:prepilin signal peptidase PulO-like enzyme (type II secretory pathway)